MMGSITAVMISFFASAVLGPVLIPFLRWLKCGQADEGSDVASAAPGKGLAGGGLASDAEALHLAA